MSWHRDAVLMGGLASEVGLHTDLLLLSLYENALCNGADMGSFQKKEGVLPALLLVIQVERFVSEVPSVVRR